MPRLTPAQDAEKARLSPDDQVMYDRVVSEGLQLKYDRQLTAMLKSHSEKYDRFDEQYDAMFRFGSPAGMATYQEARENGHSKASAQALADDITSDGTC